MRFIVLPLVIAIASVILMFVVDCSYEEPTDSEYCEMVELWKMDNHLPENNRAGWPPYRGEDECNGDK